MIENVNFPIGSIVLLDKIEKDYGFFDFMFKEHICGMLFHLPLAPLGLGLAFHSTRCQSILA
jgi:hypothetical protein